MNKIVNKLAWILPAVVAVAVIGYALWFSFKPKPEKRITGDYEAASALAEEENIPLLIVVDNRPP